MATEKKLDLGSPIMNDKAHAGPEVPSDQELGIVNHPKCDYPMQSQDTRSCANFC